jgi:hypothetical protein
MRGPGKYDDAATELMKRYHADGVIVAILASDGRAGFSVQGTANVISALPATLRQIADQVEREAMS